jgi:hypothetical protein
LRAGRYDISIEQGSGFNLPITFKHGGVPADLTGCAVRMQARSKVGASTKLIELTTQNGGIALTDAAHGKFTLLMTAAATAALEFARAVYDLEIVPSAGEPYRLLEGFVFLYLEVTR